jgi:hypothetical protein
MQPSVSSVDFETADPEFRAESILDKRTLSVCSNTSGARNGGRVERLITEPDVLMSQCGFS